MINKKALLIIDMQKGCFDPNSTKFDTDGVIKRINGLAKIFRDSGNPVIFLQQDGTKGNRFIPNTAEWEIIPELEVEKEDILMDKFVSDSFYKTNLNSELIKRNINELFITGFATDFCVEATIQSALSKDYNITIIKNAHTTGDRPHLIAEKIIEHYNWVWQHMIPTKGKIKVVDFEEIEITTPHIS